MARHIYNPSNSVQTTVTPTQTGREVRGSPFLPTHHQIQVVFYSFPSLLPGASSSGRAALQYPTKPRLMKLPVMLCLS